MLGLQVKQLNQVTWLLIWLKKQKGMSIYKLIVKNFIFWYFQSIVKLIQKMFNKLKCKTHLHETIMLHWWKNADEMQKKWDLFTQMGTRHMIRPQREIISEKEWVTATTGDPWARGSVTGQRHDNPVHCSRMGDEPWTDTRSLSTHALITWSSCRKP